MTGKQEQFNLPCYNFSRAFLTNSATKAVCQFRPGFLTLDSAEIETESKMPADETTKLHSAGGPLFRRQDLSHEEFATAWHRHGQLCTPWCLNAEVWEYIQIHMPSPSPSPSPSSSPSDSKAAPTSDTGADTIERKARRILQVADGVAIMRFQVRDAPVPTVAKAKAKAGALYFETVVLADERRFLHDESGAGAVRGDPPVYDVPDLHVDVWREMALAMGGVEHGRW
ncbi:hypothetical protein F5Y14DRAFT_426623 [Nemania sp. NC0429]|nr:hypothetical protein F5Y14DRAFT_426623 [Nemania sp. NC0429]